MILAIRTDSPDVYIGLYDQGNPTELDNKSWKAGRELSVQILQIIEDLLAANSSKLGNITGILVYGGPGSYTGLRIGISVANALAYSSSIPVVSTSGSNWLTEGLANLALVELGKYVSPDYGGEVKTTQPRK